MSFNFLDAVKNYFDGDMVSKAASYLGESTGGIQKGLEAIIPVSLAGIINKAQSSPESLMNFAKTAMDSGIASKLSSSFTAGGGGIPEAGPSILSSLFGDRVGAIANSLSDFTGLKGSTTSSLLGSIAPLALSLLGKHAATSNLTPGGVASLLASQKNQVLSAMPSGLNISKLLGIGSIPSINTPNIPEKKSNWFWPLLLGLAAILVIWWFVRGCGDKTTSTAPVIIDTVETAPPASAVVDKGPVKLKLPDGVELDAYKGGIEDRLIAFLNDPTAEAGKDNWFDFNDLNFKLGTAEILPESRKELDNITKILKAYPKVKIKVGGYTDKTGAEPANKKISKERAEAVSKELTASGVGKQVTGAEGYGSEFAKYPADAPETDRVKDRRVSISVREK